MKRIFKYALMLVVAITGVMAVSSCSKDDDEKTEVVELRAKLDGSWTLMKYDGGDITWGEYMEIKGDSMIWNSRLQGVDSKYKLTFDSGTSFSAKCVWVSDGSDAYDWEFKVIKCTSDSLETIDSYEKTRVFIRK